MGQAHQYGIPLDDSVAPPTLPRMDGPQVPLHVAPVFYGAPWAQSYPERTRDDQGQRQHKNGKRPPQPRPPEPALASIYPQVRPDLALPAGFEAPRMGLLPTP